MAVKGYNGPGIGAGTGDTNVLANKYGLKRDFTERAILTFHGHGADAYTWKQGTMGAPKFATNLAENGWVVVSDDFGGNTPWANDTAMADTDQVYQFATQLTNALAPKCAPIVDLCGWSMGGLTALNWVKRNPTLVHRVILWCPATQITYFHNNNPSGYGAEIEADYGGAAWATNIAGHEPAMEPAAYRGLPPIRIYHGDADTTVPIQQTRDFVAAVNDPNLTLHEVPGGTHTNLFGAVNFSEIADFLWGKTPA